MWSVRCPNYPKYSNKILNKLILSYTIVKYVANIIDKITECTAIYAFQNEIYCEYDTVTCNIIIGIYKGHTLTALLFIQ